MIDVCALCGSTKVDGHMETETTAYVWCLECDHTWWETDVGA